MGRLEVLQRDLPALLAELEEQGARKVQRSPARFDGMVEVRWEDSTLERRQRQALLRGWRQLTVISILVAILIAAIVVLTSL